jgi:hypothetical protein
VAADSIAGVPAFGAAGMGPLLLLLVFSAATVLLLSTRADAAWMMLPKHHM